jgi:hypothetical protein
MKTLICANSTGDIGTGRHRDQFQKRKLLTWTIKAKRSSLVPIFALKRLQKDIIWRLSKSRIKILTQEVVM